MALLAPPRCVVARRAIDVKKMVLTGEKGKAFTDGTFSHKINDASKEVPGLVVGAAVGGVTPHGLRPAAAKRLRELGLSCQSESVKPVLENCKTDETTV